MKVATFKWIKNKHENGEKLDEEGVEMVENYLEAKREMVDAGKASGEKLEKAESMFETLRQ